MKKVALILIAVLMLCMLSGCLPTGDDIVSLLVFKSESEIIKELESGIPEFKEEFSFNTDLSTNVIEIYKDFVDEHPEMFWVNGAAKLALEHRLFKTKVTLLPSYVLTKEQAEEMIPLFNAKTEEFLSKIPENLNEFEKAVFVHDMIIKTTEYNEEEAKKILNEGQTDFSVSNAYGCIVKGSAVCSGYAEAYKYIMRKLGYKCDTVECTSGGVGHAINFIYLEDEPYFLDVTNDDIEFTSERNSYTLDLPSHTYFGLTTKEAENYYSFQSEYPECTETKYNYYNYYGLKMEEYNFSEFNGIVSNYANSGLVEIKLSDYDKALKAAEIIYDKDMLRTAYFKSHYKRFTYTVPENSPVVLIYII